MQKNVSTSWIFQVIFKIIEGGAYLLSTANYRWRQRSFVITFAER